MQKELVLYLQVFIFSIFLSVIFHFIQTTSENNLIISLNKVTALIGFVLIGMSFAMSGICYFWNYFDSKIHYRKYLGLIGFGYVLTHFFITVLLLNNKFSIPDYYLNNIISFVSALIALIVFTVMAAISNKYSIQKLGAARWKKILFLGYPAYLLALIHFGLKLYELWIAWGLNIIDNPTFPPLTLLVFIFGIGVLFLRIALQIHKTFKSH